MTGSDDNLLKIWDLRNGQCIETKTDAQGPILDIRFHPTEMLIASAGADRQVNFYDFENFERVSFSDPTTQPISKIRFSIDGTR